MVSICHVDQSVKLVGNCVNAAFNVQGRQTPSIGEPVEDDVHQS